MQLSKIKLLEKKYCECFQAGVLCSDNCRCIECKNVQGNEERQALLDMAELSMRTGSPLKKLKREREEKLYLNSATPTKVAKVLSSLTNDSILSKFAELIVLSSKEAEQNSLQYTKSTKEKTPTVSSNDISATIASTFTSTSDTNTANTAGAPTTKVKDEMIEPSSPMLSTSTDSDNNSPDDPTLPLSDVYIAQERAVLDEFKKLLARIVEILRNTVVSLPQMAQVQVLNPSTISLTPTATTPNPSLSAVTSSPSANALSGVAIAPYSSSRRQLVFPASTPEVYSTTNQFNSTSLVSALALSSPVAASNHVSSDAQTNVVEVLPTKDTETVTANAAQHINSDEQENVHVSGSFSSTLSSSLEDQIASRDKLVSVHSSKFSTL